MDKNENKNEDIIVDDFKRTTSRHKKKKFKHRKQNPFLAFVEDNTQALVLFGVIIAALAVVLIGAFALKIAVAAVCVIVVLEAALAVCLHDVPIWLHGLVVIGQIVAGALCAKTVFMILCAVIYVIGILSLRVLKEARD